MGYMRLTNHQTNNYLVKGHYLYSGTWNSRSGLDSFRFSSEAPEWSLSRKNKGTGLSTVINHRNADCLLKTLPPDITNMMSIKISGILMLSISTFGRIRVSLLVLQNKICPFLWQCICIYIKHSFLWNTVRSIILTCLLVVSGE